VLDAVPIAEALVRRRSGLPPRGGAAICCVQLDKFRAGQLRRFEGLVWRKRRAIDAEAHANNRAASHEPLPVGAMLELCRAGSRIDREHDEVVQAPFRRLRWPALVFWSWRDDLDALDRDVLALRRPPGLKRGGRGRDGGYRMAEQAPEQPAAKLPASLKEA
jgi:hypothetical protein